MGNYWLDKANINTGWTLNINNLEEFVVHIDAEPSIVCEKVLYKYAHNDKPVMVNGRRRFEPIRVNHLAYDHDDRFMEVIDFLFSREPTKLDVVLKYYEEGVLIKRWNIQDAYFVEGEMSLTSENEDCPVDYMVKLAFVKAELGQI